MNHFERILIGIDQPQRDARMLRYLGAVDRAVGTKEIHLLHVRPEPPPEDATAETAITPESLASLAAEHLHGSAQERITAQIVTGAPLVEILRYALEKAIDLIVVGRWRGPEERPPRPAILPERLTRKATCSVLVLPEDARPAAAKILVPVRDSECSANAVTMACRIAAATGGTVCCLNVFHVGTGYLNVGMTLEEHTEHMRHLAEHECERLLQQVEAGGARIVTRCVPDLYGMPVPIILDEIGRELADLVVIGARGRTGAAGVLLGKVTEQLIHESQVPVLAVKKKGECIGVLRALLSLAR